MLTKIQSKSHPKHYLVHKYWGRKAHNLIAAYIGHHTKPGDIVLDPFMGSGGVVIESKKTGRKSIGVDINPITKLIVDNTIVSIEPRLIKDGMKKILDSVPAEVINLSLTKCPVCGKRCQLRNTIWKENSITKVKGYCVEHKQFVKSPDAFDRQRAVRASSLLRKYSKTKGFYYPTDRILDFVRRNGKKHIDELFSPRNLLQSAVLLQIINKTSDINLRNFYKMAFTSMLPNVSSMIPANEETATGKSGWQISKFWVPGCHTEKNVFMSFESRIDVIYQAKLETQGVFSGSPYQIYIKSAESLEFIPDNYVDYIFTDPPYGNSIAYLGLSMFWNSWLRYPVDYESEIIHDPYRNKGNDDYSDRLDKVFKELHRVLKPGKKMSFTFHNRSLKFWKIIMDAVLGSGFELEDIAWHHQAVASGTQGLNSKNTLRGDFVYTFNKPIKVNKAIELMPDFPGESILIKEVTNLFKQYDFIETAKLYEKVIPVIIRQRAFLNDKGKVLDIDEVLEKNFNYQEVKVDGKSLYGWVKV